MSFALVGPAQTDVSALERCSNVTLFGQRAHPDLPRYVKEFDVGIVPYLLTDYTANVYPTKLNEYLSMGIPVVATDLPEIRRFNREHGNVVEVAGLLNNSLANSATGWPIKERGVRDTIRKLFSLDDVVALVTGSSGGIGLALARRIMGVEAAEQALGQGGMTVPIHLDMTLQVRAQGGAA